MPSGRELPALATAVLVVFAATVALAAPGTAAVGNQPTATPTPTDPPNGPTTPPAEEPGNDTDRNDTRDTKAVKPGPDPTPRRGPIPPRTKADAIVDDDGKAHYQSLAAAVANASPGQTIVIRPGSFEGASVAVDNLTIVGFGPEETVVEDRTDGPALTVENATNVTVRSLSVDGGVAVTGDGADVTLSSLAVEGGLSIAGASVTDVRVEETTVRGGLTVGGDDGTVRTVRIVDTELTGAGLRLAGSVSDVRVQGNTISGSTRGITVDAGEYADVAIVDNDVTETQVGAVVREGVDASAFDVHRNDFGDTEVGLRSAATGTLDAERNAWGARSGPETDGNPAGSGAVVRGDVDVDPWIPSVVRLEDASADGDVLAVSLVAHAERIARYEVVVAFPSSSVDAVAVDGRALPTTVSQADGEVTISGSGDEPVSGPVVLATITFSGDLDGMVGDLRLDADRSSAFDGTGAALHVAFLTADLEVDGAPDTGTPGPSTPTPTQTTATPTPEPTETAGPPTAETPPPDGEPGSTPSEPSQTEGTLAPTESAGEPTESAAADPSAWRAVTTDLPAILSRLAEVIRGLV